MDSIGLGLAFNQTAKSINYDCLVCGTHSLQNYVDTSLSSCRTNHTKTLIKTKLHTILLNSWVPTDDVEHIICIPCFHLIDQYDVLEAQLDAMHKELTAKYVGKRGIPKESSVVKKPHSECKRKRKPSGKKFKAVDQLQCEEKSIETSDLSQSEHSVNINVNSGSLQWPEQTKLQQVNNVTVCDFARKKIGLLENLLNVNKDSQPCQDLTESSTVGPRVVYDTDSYLVNFGERLRIGTELKEDQTSSFACGHCDQTMDNIEVLKAHVQMHHRPKVLTALIPVELGLGNSMNCGIQLDNVDHTVNSSIKPFACLYCDGSFKFKSNLNLHFKEKHTPHKPFKCVDCLEGFRRSMELSRHKVYYCLYRKKNLPRKEKKSK